MSVTSKIVLGTACLTSASIIGYVHYKQKLDRDRLHEGVIRDIERQQRRKAENLYNLQRQNDLEKEIKRTEELKVCADSSLKRGHASN